MNMMNMMMALDNLEYCTWVLHHARRADNVERTDWSAEDVRQAEAMVAKAGAELAKHVRGVPGDPW